MARKNLIFIHGFRGNHLGLEQLASFFSQDAYNIYIPDLPPAGGSSLTRYDKDSYADFLASYIKTNQIEKPILIGHSLGSIIAAATAEKFPDLISKKIVFMSPISEKPAKFFAMLTPLTAVLPNRLIGFITTKYLFVPHDKNLFRHTLKTTYLCGVFSAAKFSVSHSISDFNLKKQALFLSGETDRLIPRKKTEAAVKKYRATSKYIQNAGHLINYESPATAAKIIKDFIEN